MHHQRVRSWVDLRDAAVVTLEVQCRRSDDAERIAQRRETRGRLRRSRLREEPERIQGVYAVKAQRIEPVGLVYLWPVSG